MHSIYPCFSVYIELKKFKDDPEAKEITLPSVFLLKVKQQLMLSRIIPAGADITDTNL